MVSKLPIKNCLKLKVVPLCEIERFLTECMEKLCATEENAKTFAQSLVTADHRGLYQQGLQKLDSYLKDIKCGVCDPKVCPGIEKESETTALVCGKNGLGAVVGKFAMNLAIKKAAQNGIGLVSCYDSNDFGTGIYYVLDAIKNGCIGCAFSNASPEVVPAQANNTLVLGRNPMTVGAPAANNDYVIINMASNSTKIKKTATEKCANKVDACDTDKSSEQACDNEQACDTEISCEQACDTEESSEQVCDSEQACDTEKTCEQDICKETIIPQPIDNTELFTQFGGYTGAFFIEIICGILSGSCYGQHLRELGDHSVPANIGQCFVALNPRVFMPGFGCRLTDLTDGIKKLDLVDPKKPVELPGDPERIHMNLVDKLGGIPYANKQLIECEKIAAELEVDPLEITEVHVDHLD